MKPGTLLQRCSLLLVLACAAAIAGLNFFVLKSKIEKLQSNLAREAAERQEAVQNLATANSRIAQLGSRLNQAQAALKESREREQKAGELATAEQHKAAQLQKSLLETRSDLDSVSAKLAAYRATGLDTDEVLQAARQLKAYQSELASATSRAQALEAKLNRLVREQSEVPVVLPESLKARVIAIDPKWNFVVLDAGEKAGALERGELLVSRGGKLLARARISRVHAEQCIANVLPGWDLSGIAEGDTAIPAPPHS